VAFLHSFLLLEFAIFTGYTPQGVVKSASFAMIVNLTILLANHSGLFPDTGAKAILTLVFRLD
jgi:hypothetical protein